MSQSATPPKKTCGSFLRLLFCCLRPQKNSDLKVDPSQMHSIVVASRIQSPEIKTDPGHLGGTDFLWKSAEDSYLIRDALRSSLRTEAQKFQENRLSPPHTIPENTLETLIRNLSEFDSGENHRNMLQSITAETLSADMRRSRFTPEPMFSDEDDSLVQRLKFKELPEVSTVSRSEKGPANAFTHGFPLKPVTPGAFHKKIRIPAAKPKMGLILESLQREENAESGEGKETVNSM